MRLLSFSVDDVSSFGVVGASGVIDAGARLRSRYASLRAVIADDGLDSVRELAQQHGADYTFDEIAFEPVIPASDKVICVGINYRPHIEETGRDAPEYPLLFTRFASSQTGHEQPLVAPALSHRFDYEGELALVIGKPGRHIPVESALQHVVGYACFNDGSVRDYQRHSTQFTAGKNFTHSGSFGPWITTADEIGDPSNLTLQTRLNGAVMQSAHVSELVFDVPTLIAYVSSFAALLPGDVIVTGTPGGVGYVRKPPVYMQSGDVVEVDISGIGVLRNRIVDEVNTSQQVAQA